MNCEVCKKPRECIIGSFYAECNCQKVQVDLPGEVYDDFDFDFETPVIPNPYGQGQNR